ncbi:DUF4145 domain-containing protein [Bacillus safensis]|uniref:DUF4145 domain-containing protein n=1 Tax=Bacillus safensis TaxID=561879 RepID=UPI0022804CC5|nr:DUF4145 domain-containing protein [Bacillus safensis]MCY7675723.1 DUF4145 domain-containing protein [Bacillus safensis]MCY7699784.1 DUF4145 domain-containing protein [Bacillus safensis]MEC3628325.1 DUF4145 domain-containing protein [Bacillus safensis]
MQYLGDNMWQDVVAIEGESFNCGYCNSLTAPSYGYVTSGYDRNELIVGARILICPNCKKPTFFDDNIQYPSANNIMGSIKFLPDDVQELYKEVCDSFSVHAYTGASILARKMIMNIAIEKEAAEDLNFAGYVEYLVENGVVPNSAEKWLNAVRKNGNEAAHKTRKSSKEETEKIINFLVILLRSVYEFEGEI